MASDASTPSSDHLERLRAEEYAALRATIRERGTRRVSLVVATLVAWAALVTAGAQWTMPPLWTLVPLIVLAAGFEGAFALHVGVERIGRYLQVEYETAPGAPRWEHTAMAFGATPVPPAGRVDPLFSLLFAAATLLNLAPLASLTFDYDGGLVEAAVFCVLHLTFLIRIVRARAYAARQRELDLAALRRTAP